ncbi:MAG: response regulator transcription factor [Chloroflexi bacterium]|nr:response regulator transcription factor [Chloroflexota bacterium]
MIKLLIAEDHQMVRAGLRALLEKAGDIEVVGEASNGQEAVLLTQKLAPHVLVMDIRMPILNGIQAAERIRGLKLPVNIVLLSMFSDEGLVHQALKSGAKGYVLKSAASEELLWAVRAAHRGETFLSGPVSAIVVDQALNPRMTGTSPDPFDNLSPREKEILQLIAEEHTSSEIGSMLAVSEKTVEKHRAHLMEKLGAKNLAGLVRLAVKYGLVDRETP